MHALSGIRGRDPSNRAAARSQESAESVSENKNLRTAPKIKVGLWRIFKSLTHALKHGGRAEKGRSTERNELLAALVM
jgi:hypothetical protein